DTGLTTERASANGATDAYDTSSEAVVLKWSGPVTEHEPNYFLNDRTFLELLLPELGGDREVGVTLDTGAQQKTVQVGVVAKGFETAPIWLSPTARYAITLRRVSAIQPGWRKFDAGFGPVTFSSDDRQIPDWLHEYVLVDFKTSSVVSLTNTPVGNPLAPLKVVWINDRVAIVSNVFPPNTSAAEEVPDNSIRPAIIEYDVVSTRWKKIIDTPQSTLSGPKDTRPERFTDIEWRGDELTITRTAGSHGALDPLIFDRGKSWELVPPRRTHSGRQKVPLRLIEDLGTPPRLVFDSVAGELDLTPQIEGLATSYVAAQVREFTWTSASGRSWRGALVFPREYRVGERFPLVIQTHGLDPQKFLSRGPSPTVFAAQALAANNMFVLQMEDQFDTISSLAEGPTMTDAYESAIRTLSAEGLVDAKRVGLVGFSRTAYHVKYAISHATTPYVAAVTADGFDFGYMFYINFFDQENGALRRDAERVNGGPPFGPGLKSWFERAPALRADKIETPLLVQAIGPASLLYEWEMYAALKLQERPVELQYFPDGDHNLAKSCEQVASVEATVDWLTYWISGTVHPESKSIESYRRWKRAASDFQMQDSVN
ncbi:MAG: alpha/beta hydrolase family protein, partial [Steroidobacteraceae bacterium]